MLVRCLGTGATDREEYPLEANMLRVFAKFIGEGKRVRPPLFTPRQHGSPPAASRRLTIRLKSPAVDLAVSKGGAAELGAFYQALVRVHREPESVTNAPGTAGLLLTPGSKKVLAEGLQRLLDVGPGRDMPASVPEGARNTSAAAGLGSPLPPAGLRTVRVVGHQLTEVPGSVARLAMLTSLDLSDNRLTAFPADLSSLSSLRCILVRGNLLTSIASLCTPSLVLLDASHNRIPTLPMRLWKRCTQLETLKLCGNRIVELSPWIRKLRKLRDLRLSGNRLE